MIYVQAVWDVLYHPLHALFFNERELVRMRCSRNGVTRKMAAVIDDVCYGTMSEEEREWKARIEGLRGKLEASDEILSIADYGAQSPMRQLSASTMYAGRVVTRSVKDVCRSSSKPLKWSLFLFRLIRTMKPGSCLELGTCLGISGSYIGAALRMNGAGALVTVEGAEALAVRAKENFTTLGFTNIVTVTGRFQDTLEAVIESSGPFNAVFIDGHHDGAATLRYFETILPALAPGAIVVFDDIGWSMEMHEAWKMLRSHRSVSCAIDLFDMGVCSIGTTVPEQFTIAI